MRIRSKGLSIVFKARVLLTAFTVGLLHVTSAQAAMAPMKSLVHIQMSPRIYSKVLISKQWKDVNRQYACLDQIWTHESHWNPKALNKSSGAFGIAQFLPQTWGNYHYPLKPKNPLIQVKAGLRYITVRYGSACKAWSFWKKHYWY
jgi:hypothetical protein